MTATEARTLATFGRSIRSFRKQRKLSQDDLAEAARHREVLYDVA